ncbi:MAG: hypothetical protein MRY21_02865 [Simkaniaceae bacterium]|nr:hypothetical protein [Simkaniaceae bacterium]
MKIQIICCAFFCLYCPLLGLNISLDETARSLALTTATAGSPPDRDVFHSTYTFDSEATLSLTSITATIDNDMPTNTQLEVLLESPSMLALSSVQQLIASTDVRTLVTNIPPVIAPDTFNLTVWFSATGPVSEQNSSISLSLSVVEL